MSNSRSFLRGRPCGLTTSIPGIGPATATEVVIATNELKNITDPKKLACHAGVAPFNYQSGSSVRGRPGVSQHARKRLKSLFHLAAMSSIRVEAGRPMPGVAGLLSAGPPVRERQEGKIGSPKRQDVGAKRCSE